MASGEDDGARLRLLEQASQAFESVGTDRQRLADVIARTAADLVGDGCAVFMLAPGGETLRMVSTAHRERVLEVVNRTYMSGTPIHMSTSSTNMASVVRSGRPVLIPVLDPAALAASADPALRPIVLQLNINSLCIVPVHARGVVIGVLALLRSQPGMPYSQDDQAFLQDLADRAGVAVDNALLSEPESR